MTLPYPCPVICGVIENSDHERKYEDYMDDIYELEYLSKNTSVFYAQTKTANFMISKRDMFGIGFNYVLPNAEVIMGCRSIRDDADYLEAIKGHNAGKKPNEYVRAFYTLDLYHLRPWYERNSNYTVVTYYSHLDLGGSVPTWIINGMISDTPKIILSLKEYIDKNIKLLSQPGQIHIPLRMLEYVGIYPDEKLYRVKGGKSMKKAKQKKVCVFIFCFVGILYLLYFCVLLSLHSFCVVLC